MRRITPLFAIMAIVVATSAINAQEQSIEQSSFDAPIVEINPPGTPVSICDGCDNTGCDGGCDGFNAGCCNDCRQGSFWSRCKCRHQAKWWGYPGEFRELPLGSAINPILQAQAMRGEEARLTLYDFDFISGTATLHSKGRARLARLAKSARRVGGAITIESMNSELDQRRLYGVRTLASEAHGLTSSQIVVAPPIAAGLSGEEAMITRQNHLDHARQYGVREFDFGSFSPEGGSSGGSQ